jgi:hypothetical protein
MLSRKKNISPKKERESSKFFGKTSAIISLAISIMSFSISGYLGWNDIFKKPNLNSTINLVYLMPFQGGERNQALYHILHNEIKSKSISPSGLNFLNILSFNTQEVIDMLRQTSFEAFKFTMEDRKKNLGLDSITYNPPDTLIAQYLTLNELTVSFYIPLTITNTGNEVCTISNIFLQIKSKKDTSKKWVYVSFFEVNKNNLKSLTNLKTLDLFGEPNTGYSVLPNSSLTINPIFMKNKQPEENMKEDEYLMRVFAYSGKNKLILETEEQLYKLTSKNLLNVFKNGKSFNFVFNTDEQAKDYLNIKK